MLGRIIKDKTAVVVVASYHSISKDPVHSQGPDHMISCMSGL